MRLFGYYALHSFVNQLKKLCRTWVLVFILVCLVLGGLIGFGAAMLEDTVEENAAASAQTQEAPVSEKEEASLPISASAIIELAAGGAIMALFFFEAISADKNGSKIKMKPEPDGLAFITQKINEKFGTNLTNKNVIMIGDSAQDIIAGKAFGCKTVACRGGMGNREKLLEQKADFCFSVASEIEKFIDVLSKDSLSREETASIQNYAMVKEVPIVMEEGSNFICNYIKEHNCKSILEIGTAIGFSTVKFAKLSDDIKVTTIEIDQERFNAAQENIKSSGVSDRITSILGDALEAQIDTKFDLIFIDAAKAQYIKFFEKYKSNLTEKGVFISDNLSFHGMVEDLSLTHNYSTIKLVKKIRKYIDFLKKNEEFHTEFFKIGDGIAVSKRYN